MTTHCRTGEQIEKFFRKHGPLTIGQAAYLLGLNSERVRRHVQEPAYRRVDRGWTGRGWVWRWAWIKERCDCGRPAWFEGEALILFDRTSRVEKLLLCRVCVLEIDPQMRIHALWNAGSN